MQLPNNLSAIEDFLVKIPQQRVAQVITLGLVCYMAFILAKITWLATDTSVDSRPVALPSTGTAKAIDQQDIDLSAIKKMNLFGIHSPDKPKVVPVQVQDAP